MNKTVKYKVPYGNESGIMYVRTREGRKLDKGIEQRV
jgi:hypothetical protein